MASLKQAIRAKCKDCIYDPAAPGTYLQQIELCTSSKTCALWPVRPMTVATINVHRKEKSAANVDVDAILAGLEDDEEDEVAEAAI